MSIAKNICDMTYDISPTICGTDGWSYNHIRDLSCAASKDEGMRINLRLKHDGPCYLWERYGLETYEAIIVSVQCLLNIERNPIQDYFFFDFLIFFCRFLSCLSLFLLVCACVYASVLVASGESYAKRKDCF